MTKAELIKQNEELKAQLANTAKPPKKEYPIAFIAVKQKKHWSVSKQIEGGYAKVTSKQYPGCNLVGFTHIYKPNVVIFKWMPDNKS